MALADQLWAGDRGTTTLVTADNHPHGRAHGLAAAGLGADTRSRCCWWRPAAYPKKTAGHPCTNPAAGGLTIIGDPRSSDPQSVTS